MTDLTLKLVLEELAGWEVKIATQDQFVDNLKPLIRDVFSSMADDVNQSGLKSQICWLYDNGVDLREIVAVAKGAT